jgi:23S rRNA-/tRNA-specific pseudouridylate synthase
VNGHCVKKSYALKVGDTISLEPLERFVDGGVLEESPVFPVDIRYEAEDYAVVYKPK